MSDWVKYKQVRYSKSSFIYSQYSKKKILNDDLEQKMNVSCKLKFLDRKLVEICAVVS